MIWTSSNSSKCEVKKWGGGVYGYEGLFFMTIFSEDISRILVYLDNEKAKTTNKESERYTVLCIVSSL
jgi:hypothetical protein